MGTNVSAALDMLRSLGTAEEIRVLADTRSAPVVPPRANAHIHLPPNFSAFNTVEQAVQLAAEEQISVLGVSNYYDYDVYGEFVVQAQSHAIFPLFGLEIIAMQPELRDAGVRVNDPGNPGKTYLCGKGITRFANMSAEAGRLIEAIRRNDGERMKEMVDCMRGVLSSRGFAAQVTVQSVIDMIVERHGSPPQSVYLQERHISQAFQEDFFRQVSPSVRLGLLSELLGAPAKLSGPEDSVGMQNELRSHLMKAGKPAFVDETFLSFAEARQLVLELGGIPSYPVLADGASPICQFEADPARLIDELLKREVYAVEWIPIRNARVVVEDYVTAMRAAGLVVTAGTEHNTLDLIPIDPACKDGPLPTKVRDIFWEGACVVAAHQFLCLHGECGYVDDAGNLNPVYATADERILRQARIGEAVIQRYFDLCVPRRSGDN